MPIIFHIDLNAFFASCEIARNPSLKDKPIVIGGTSRRSIVSTASYEARKYGIHSAMPIYQAKELCKDLIILPVDMAYYKQKSNQFFAIVDQYTHRYEIASVDECYVDMTEVIAQYPTIIDLAKALQQQDLDELDLGCSFGISNNKFLAKMASDMKKPLGITILNQANIKYFLWPLDVENMHGIGKKTAEKLRKANILTIADLADEKNLDIIKRVMGKHGYLYYKRANGIDYSQIDLDRDSFKSIGNSTTLEKDTADEDIIKDTLQRLSRQVSDRARNKNVVSDQITVTIKYSLNESVSKNLRLDEAINDFESIYQNAALVFDQLYDNRPVRLLGVSLSHVININDYNKQLSLFTYQEEDLRKQDQLIEELKKKYHLQSASSLIKKE